ncbi:MAG: flagellar basal body rod protein FlgC [Eubacteriales bacterium]
MGIFSGMNTSASALTAQRLRLDLIANNIANINTTNTGKVTAGGNPIPYSREVAYFSASNPNKDFSSVFRNAKESLYGKGVEVTSIMEDDAPYRLEYNPDSPDAIKTAEEGLPVGYVRYPNVNIVEEMVDMISASRAYEANITALNASKAMASKALEIGKG